MEKVVVTGGSGFIGSHVVDALVEEGYEVHVIDNLSGGRNDKLNPMAFYHNKDLRKIEDLLEVFFGAKFVFHLAAMPRVQYSIENPFETNDANVNGTLNVLIASQKCGVKRVIYSASSSAYGDQDVMPLVEEMSAKPKSPYGLQKYIGELYCKLWSEIYGVESVCLRYFNVYGPRLDPDGAYALVIGRFLKQRKENLPMTITGDGEQTRDFTHVKDVARANVLAAKSDKVGNGGVINIGAGKNVSIKRVAELIGGPIQFIPARLEPRNTLADNSKARELLDWEPKIEFEEGIGELKRIFGV